MSKTQIVSAGCWAYLATDCESGLFNWELATLTLQLHFENV